MDKKMEIKTDYQTNGNAVETAHKPSVKERIVKVQNELRISKDGKNSFANYDYYKPDTILLKLNPLLEKYRLHTKFQMTCEGEFFRGVLVISDWDDKEGEIVYVFDILKAAVKGANEAQNSGATLTYCKRYSLMNAFNIADNDVDFDADRMTQKKINKAQKQAIWDASGHNKDLIINVLGSFGYEHSDEVLDADFNQILKEINNAK